MLDVPSAQNINVLAKAIAFELLYLLEIVEPGIRLLLDLLKFLSTEQSGLVGNLLVHLNLLNVLLSESHLLLVSPSLERRPDAMELVVPPVDEVLLNDLVPLS